MIFATSSYVSANVSSETSFAFPVTIDTCVSNGHTKPITIRSKSEHETCRVYFKCKKNVLSRDRICKKRNCGDHCKRPESSEERYPGRHVGVDLGKKNLVTMTDTSGITLRYTCRQRRFEGKLPRHLRVLEKEKAETDGPLQTERDLSKHSRKTNRHGRFLAYLAEKKLHDEWTSSFYLEKKWRGWKFRLYCNRKKSEDMFLNRVVEKYGKDCVLHFGDWSR